MAYVSSENKYVCDFCGIGFSLTSPYGAWGLKKEGWEIKVVSIPYTVPKKPIKNRFTYSERVETKPGTELKCDVCIRKEKRKEKINKIKNAIHTR